MIVGGGWRSNAMVAIRGGSWNLHDLREPSERSTRVGLDRISRGTTHVDQPRHVACLPCYILTSTKPAHCDDTPIIFDGIMVQRLYDTQGPNVEMAHTGSSRPTKKVRNISILKR